MEVGYYSRGEQERGEMWGDHGELRGRKEISE